MVGYAIDLGEPSIEGFGEVDEKDIKILALLFALLLDLSGAQYYVNCSPVFTETTLAFRDHLIKEMGFKSV